MAINKTIFTADRTAQKGEIFNWLKANAEDYFDEISQNADGNISCRLENGAELLFMFDTSTTVYKIISKTGNTQGIYANVSAPYTEAGIVTSNGIMLISYSFASTDNIVIISKTNSGATSVSAYGKTSSSINTLFQAFIDLDNDVNWMTKNFQTIFDTPVTSLAPVCFASGNYCEHVFMTIFSQFVNSPCIMQINGKKYAYGGYLALEE